MFSQKILECVQRKPACDITDKYVLDVMNRFCIIATSELDQFSSEIKIENVTMILAFLRLFQEFEQKENQAILVRAQQNLFQKAQSNQKAIAMAIAMNTIIGHLKKGQQNDGAQKFYAGINAAVDFLDDRKKKLSANGSGQAGSPVQANPFEFFSGSQPVDIQARSVLADHNAVLKTGGLS